MRIDIELPAEFEIKWIRLKNCFGGDEELAIAAVDMLWDEYEKDVKTFEKMQAYHSRQIIKGMQELAELKASKKDKARKPRKSKSRSKVR